MPGIGAGDLRGDEVLYAAVAKGLDDRGEWLDLHLGGEPYWRKPPLLFWLVALSYRLLGLSTLSARLPSALFALAACVALCALARRFVSENAAILAAIVLATTPRIVRTGPTLNLDTPVMCFTLVSLLLVCSADEGHETVRFAGAGVAWGLAVLTKGAFGLVAPAVCVLYVAIAGRPDGRRTRPLTVAVASALAVALPWHVHSVARWGPPFLETYLGHEVIDRAAGRLWPDQKIDSYPVELLRDDWPWIAFTVLGVLISARRALRGDRHALFIAIWAVGYYVALHASVFRRGRYLMHFFPPASVLAALAVERVMPGPWLEACRRRAPAVAVAVGLVGMLVPLRRGKPNDVRPLGPVVSRLAPDPAEPIPAYAPDIHFRASSLVYLGRDVRTIERHELRTPRELLVVRQGPPREHLRGGALEEVYANRHFAVLVPARQPR